MTFAKSRSKLIGLISGPALFLIIYFFFRPEGMTQEANAILASTAWIACWWITECIPIAVTSLLPIILFPLTGGMDLNTTTASFGHRYIFLYIGGFILAVAIERWNLHKRIALTVINWIGSGINRIILGFMLATAFLSMWISNTATSVMMLPIAMAIVSQLKDNPQTKEDENLIFGKALMLAVAYSASIGGLATLIGTPPNLIFAGVVEELYDIQISFSQWLMFGLPISMVMLFICFKYLTLVAFSFKQDEFPGGKAEIKRLLDGLGKISYEEKWVLGVFAFTALAWISRTHVINRWLPQIDDTMIAVFSAVILFILPASKEKGRRLLTWTEAVKIPWGILLLFGGGLALAEGFKTSGLAEWIGTQMTLLQGASLFVLLLVVVASVNFLTEITSNLATTAMILPILAPIAYVLGVHPYIIMAGATVAASCAFMLPVATPPNAVVFGSGYLRIPDMVRTGIWLNIISIILLTLICYFALPLIWDFDPSVFPTDWIN